MLRTIPMASNSVMCIQGYYIVSSLAEAALTISLHKGGGSSTILAKYKTDIVENGSGGWQKFDVTFGPLTAPAIIQFRIYLVTYQSDYGAYFGLDEIEMNLGDACIEGENMQPFVQVCSFFHYYYGKLHLYQPSDQV